MSTKLILPGLIMALLCLTNLSSCNNRDNRDSSINSIEKYRGLRDEKLNQPRPVIHNNDGCDAYHFPFKVNHEFAKQSHPGHGTWGNVDYEFSISKFLNLLSCVLKGSDVGTISLAY